jgi:uncharacterized membrane protein
MSRTIKILIFSSILLNILLIGFIIGNASHRFFGEDYHRKKSPELAARLPLDKEKLFFNTMKKVHKENRDIQKQIRRSRERIFSILTAPQFDEASYQSEVENLYKLRGVMMQRLSNATKKLAEQFNQEERKALAEYLRHLPGSPRKVRPPGKE